MKRTRLLGLALAFGLVAAAGPARAIPLIGDQTIVLLTSAPALIGAGLNFSNIAPGDLNLDIVGRPEAAFPITGGDLTGLSGTIEHSGGIELSDGMTTLGLANLVIDFDTNQLIGTAFVNGGEVGSGPIADVAQCTLLFGTAQQCIDGDCSILLDGWKLSLNEGAAGVFADLFGIGGLDGLQFGVARIDIRFIPEPGTAALVGMGLVVAALRGRRTRANR